MPVPAATQLWFYAPDVMPLAEHAVRASDHAAGDDRQVPAGPALHLHTDGPLAYLVSGGRPAALVDLFDPASTARAYALGHGPHPDHPHTAPAVPPAPVAVLGLLHPCASLMHSLRDATRAGCDWLVLTHTGTGWRALLTRRPRTPRAGRWRPARLEVAGLPADYPGEIADNTTFDGWCLPRFTPTIAARIAADLHRTHGPTPRTDMPGGLRPVALTDRPATDLPPGEQALVGLDPDGRHRLGAGRWHWVATDRLPTGTIDTYAGPAGTHLPDPGQPTATTMGALMWLSGGHLVTRTLHPDGSLVAEWACPPDYRHLDPDTAIRLRAVEHHLRTRTNPPVPPRQAAPTPAASAAQERVYHGRSYS